MLSHQGYGAHCDDYGVPYVTVAASIGVSNADVDVFLARLRSTLAKVRKMAKRTAASGASAVGSAATAEEPAATDAAAPQGSV